MRKIAIVGSGQAGLLAAHGLSRAGYAVRLYSDRTPEDPAGLVDTLGDFARTRRWVSKVMGAAADWEAAKGLVTVGGRQLRNTLSP